MSASVASTRNRAQDFANGGDRTQDNIPEMDVEDNNISFEFGVGGTEKRNSSSRLVASWESRD